MLSAAWPPALLLTVAFILALVVPGASLAANATAPPATDISGFRIQGAYLGMTRQEFARISDIPVKPATAPDGSRVAWRAKTKRGFSGGGMFQVMFTRDETGGKAYVVTLNRRWHRENEELDPIFDQFVKTYGPPDMFCVRQYEKHHVYHAYWGGRLTDCSHAGDALKTPHLYLNLVSGKWTELFVNLSDPQLLQKNIEFLRTQSR